MRATVGNIVTFLLASIAVAGSAGCGMSGALIAAAGPSTLSISPSPLSLLTAHTAQLEAMETTSTGVTSDVTSVAAWTSSSPTIANVGTGGTATCVNAGTVQLTASAKGASVSVALTCTAPPPVMTAVHLVATPAVIRSNAPFQYTLMADYADGTAQDVTSSAAWSTDPIVAGLPSPGLLACNHPGQATLSVSVAGLAAHASFACILRAITPTPGFVESAKTFDGPFASWANVQTAFGAKGDGVTDDSKSLQAALNSVSVYGGVIWIPHGNYVLTSPLQLKGAANFSIIGEDPKTTTLTWKGASGGTMLTLSGCTGFMVKRLTWDGTGSAGEALEVTWDQTTNYYPTHNSIQDSRIINVATGIHTGWAGETTVSRVHFDHNTKAGISLGSWNALNFNVLDCLFTDSAIGVTNTFGAGAFNVSNSVFVRSTYSDIAIGDTGPFSFRNNLSVNSKRFLTTGRTGAPASLVIQGNTIDKPGSTPIWTGTPASMMLLDNAFIGLDPSFNVMYSNCNTPITFISTGNTFSVTKPFAGILGNYTSIDEAPLAADAPFTAVVPTDVYVPPASHRRVFEVPTASDDTVIQAAINNAVSVGGVVHFPTGNYGIFHTLDIPDGANIALLGDGTISNLVAVSTLQGPVLRSFGKGVEIEEMRFSSYATSPTSTSFEAHVPDVPSTRVFCAECNFHWANTGSLVVDGIDDAAIETRVGTIGPGNVAMAIHGGLARQKGIQTLGKVAAFMTSSSEYTVDTGAHLLINDGWHDTGQGNIQFALSGDGSVTHQGGAIYSWYTPSMSLNEYKGSLSLLGVTTSSTVAVYAGSAAKILSAGVLQTTGANPITSSEPTATIAAADNVVSNNNGTPVPIPNISSTPQYLESMMAMARNVTLSPRSPQTTDTTTIKMERLTFDNAPMGIHIANSSTSGPTGNYTISAAGGISAPTQGACSQSETSLSGSWTLRDGGDGFQALVRDGSILSEDTATDSNGNGVKLVNAMTNARDRWLVQPVGDGSFAIVNRATGNVLTQTSSGCAYAAKNSGGAQQHWLVDRAN